MRPIYQSGLTLLAVAAAVLVFFVVRWEIAAGRFTTVTPVSPGVCRVFANAVGPEDLQIDAPHKVIFISSAGAPNSPDGLYALKLGEPAATPVRLAGTPGDFHPHGISLYRAPDGSETLMAVNRQASGFNAVELFTVSFDGGMPKLTNQSSIAGGLLVSPGAIFAIGPDHFYVTNDHGSRSGPLRFAEDYLLWPHADLLYFNGTSFKIAVQRLGAPAGLFVPPGGDHLYVSLASERRLIAFSREPFMGNLAEIGSLSLPARPDRIAMDAAGNLIVAGQPRLAHPAPSEIFRVRLDKAGVPQGYNILYANDGREISGAGVTAVMGKELLIGSALDNKLLSCAMK